MSEVFRTKSSSLVSLDLKSLFAPSMIKPLNGAKNIPNRIKIPKMFVDLLTPFPAICLSQYNKLLLKNISRKEFTEKNSVFVQNNGFFKESLKVDGRKVDLSAKY